MKQLLIKGLCECLLMTAMVGMVAVATLAVGM